MKPIKKELYVTGQALKFSRRPQVEPEAQAAVREFRVEAPAGYQGAGGGPAGVVNQQGTIPAVVQYGSTAGEMAQARRTSCAGCKHFDVAAWRKFVAVSTGPLARAEDKQTIQTMRARIMMAGYGYVDNNGELDVEATLMAHGICRVLSDWAEGVVGRDPMHWPIVPWREATCPPSCHAGAAKLDVVTPAQPLGLFVPKDFDAEKIGAKRYDEVLRAAQGKR
jgi:hypothetical protein